jgi:anti-sigma B factor antagonist
VDLSGVTYISSAGWGIFIGEIKEIRNRGGDLKLAGMVGDVFEVFQLLEFQTILEAYPSADQATDAFSNRTSYRA